MIRAFLIALPLLALAACATPGPTPAQQQAINIEANTGARVYNDLQVREVEQQMLDDDHRLTYGYAVVNCGLRSPEWFSMLQAVYEHDLAEELQVHPLSQTQLAEAQAYAATQVSNPAPPPYICHRLSTDDTLADMDYAVGMQSLLLASLKKPS